MTLYEILRLAPPRAPATVALTLDAEVAAHVLVAFAKQAQPGTRYQARKMV